MKKQTACQELDYLKAEILFPEKIFVSWQLDEKKLEFICNYFEILPHRASRSMRLYEIISALSGRELKFIQEVVLRPESNSWLFKGISLERKYLVELGLMVSEKKFFPVLKSNPVNANGMDQTEPAVQEGLTAPSWFNQVSTYTYYESTERRGQE